MSLETTGPSLSFVIPVKDVSRLEHCIEAVRQYGVRNGEQIEILICGGVDRLDERGCARFVKTNSSQKGDSIRAGMCASKGEVAIVCDDDFPVTYDDLDLLRGTLSEADLALGNRYLPTSVFLTTRPWIRRLAGFVFRVLVCFLFDLRGFDTQCGIKAFKKDTTRVLFKNHIVSGFAYDVELALRARLCSLRIVQIPVHWKSSPETTLRMYRAIPSMLKELLVLLWRVRRARLHGIGGHL